MRTPTKIRAEITGLREALATGASSVSYEGRQVTYRSVDHIRQTIASLEAELAGMEGRPRRRMRVYAEFDRGRR